MHQTKKNANYSSVDEMNGWMMKDNEGVDKSKFAANLEFRLRSYFNV